MDQTLVEQAQSLSCIPTNWQHAREDATGPLLIRMAEEIERLQRIVDHLCPDKSDDV